MNEEEKRVEDIAEAFIRENMIHGKTAESVRVAFKHPAFIGDIVRQTLEYVAENAKIIRMGNDIQSVVNIDIDRIEILAMHTQITDNIIKKK